MFCTSCGKAINENNTFCGNCGTKSGVIPKAEPLDRPVPQTESSEQPIQPITPTQTVSKSKGSILTILTIFGVLLTISGIIGFVFFNIFLIEYYIGISMEQLVVSLVISIIVLVVGVICGVFGISKMKNNNKI